MRYYNERFSIRPLAENHMHLLRDALTQWKEIERRHINNILKGIGKRDVAEARIGSEFDLWFSKVRQRRADANDNVTRAMARAGGLLYPNFAVSNIGDVENFAVFLPQAVDEGLKVEVATHGRRVAALFFLEMFARKFGDERGIDNKVFDRCEAAWLLASRHGGLAP